MLADLPSPTDSKKGCQVVGGDVHIKLLCYCEQMHKVVVGVFGRKAFGEKDQTRLNEPESIVTAGYQTAESSYL